MATDDTNQAEIDALRDLINDDAIRDERGVAKLTETRLALKERIGALEADGTISGGHFDDIIAMFEEANTFLTPISGAVKLDDGSAPTRDDPTVAKTGVVTDKNVIEAHGDIDSIGQNQSSR